jgi:hypothetical protein
MVSIWWVAAAFVLGGYAGVLVFALMAMARSESDRAATAGEAVQRDGAPPGTLEPTWRAN